MTVKTILTRILLASMVLTASGCAATPTSPQPLPAAWQTSTPGDEGIDATRLRQMMDVIDAADLPIDSVVVVRHGKLAFEEYPNPEYRPQEKHLLYSVTKRVTSALIGIAIDKGFIESVDQRVIDFFPDMAINNLDVRRQSLTLEHLLSMSCGFEWEGPDDNLHTWGRANQSGNPVKYVLNQPMSSDPGTQFLYNGGCSHLLSAILTKTTGQSMLEFARKHLFKPLGITDIKWPRDPQGIYYGGQDIWLTLRDMAKFGQLFLNQGTWEGRQIIPAEWVARSSETRLSLWAGGYGHQWWTFPRSGIYYASGAYEQRIYVIPDLDMVVVFTAFNKAGGAQTGRNARWQACRGLAHGPVHSSGVQRVRRSVLLWLRLLVGAPQCYARA
jgi:CubicO group peptidase (beta-lactamase class C family)